MNVGAKLGAYVLLLGAVLGGGAIVGAAAGPIDSGGDDRHGADHDTDEPSTEPGALPAGGLLVSQDGFTFVTTDRLADEGPFTFIIEDEQGEPVADYVAVHDRELHLIVASRSLREFIHIHPVRDANGIWSVDLPALPGGSYRAFADFQPAGGEALTLGIDIDAPGAVALSGPLTPSARDEVDSYEIRLDGNIVAGQNSEVTVTASLDDEVIQTDPYLGAGGHLVALRDGDLAYLHVHPLDSDGRPIRFMIDVPSPGTYALFFDFLHDGKVRTAHFVVETNGDPENG